MNGWPSRISDMPFPAGSPEDHLRNLELEGSRSAFVDDKTVFIILKDGTIHPVELVADGKTVSKLTIAPALAQTTVPAVVKKISEGHLFVGSTVGPSVLLKTARVEEDIKDDHGMETAPSAVDYGMDLDDDDGQLILYLRSVT